MAYLDPNDAFAHATRLPIADAIGTVFERREWSVIALARWDGLSSLQAPSRFSLFLQRIFGGGVDRRLADPRLEALRRFAVLAWHHGYTLPVSAMKAFKEAGYTLDHIELLLARVATERATRERGAAS